MRRLRCLGFTFISILVQLTTICASDDRQISQLPPAIISTIPSSGQAGGPPFSLAVNGNNFNEFSIVQWNGANRPTTFMGPNMLNAMISAEDIASAANINITVFNPFPGGGVSNPFAFRVNNPAPMILALTPESAIAGGPAFALTVTGTNFILSSAVQWNGVIRPTTYISDTRLSVSISAGDIANATAATITVANPHAWRRFLSRAAVADREPHAQHLLRKPGFCHRHRRRIVHRCIW
jgi:hypothetical protein